MSGLKKMIALILTATVTVAIVLASLYLVDRYEKEGPACKAAGVGVVICFINPAHRWQ